MPKSHNERDFAQLTPKQRRFVQELAKGASSYTAAAVAAGYPKRSAAQIAYENLRKPHIASAIADMQTRAVRQVDMSREASIARLMTLSETAQALGQPAVAVRCEELAGKLAGLYIERSMNTNLTAELASMPAAEQRALAAEIVTRLNATFGL